MFADRAILTGLLVLVSFGRVQDTCFAQMNNFTAITTEKVGEIELLHQKATDLLLKNDFQAAIRTYSDILLLEPDDETAYTGLGQIYLVLGQYKKANEAFRNALNINPDNEVAAFGIKKIMDPDGVEGMITKQQEDSEELESVLPVKNKPQRMEKPKIEKKVEKKPFVMPSFFAPAKMDKRISAERVTKMTTPPPAHPAASKTTFAKNAPKALPAPEPDYRLRKNIPVRHTQRPGLLHAKRVQMALKIAGCYEGQIDGLVGGKTKTALKLFQKNSGLIQTGKITSRTWSALALNL